MSDKIQMTEEQYKEIFWSTDGYSYDEMLSRAKAKGYIIKSELQQKVEEAEKMYDYWYSDKETNCEVIMDAMKIAIQLLKQSHPEFKK